MIINKFNYNKLIYICWLVQIILTFTGIITYILTESNTNHPQSKICYIKLYNKNSKSDYYG